MSHKGSKITALAFCRAAFQNLNSQHIEDISDDEILCWLDDIRDRIGLAAIENQATNRDFATTLVGVVIGHNSALLAHVGDGAFVYRCAGEIDWHVASWPSQGEYASTTYFVTDEPSPKLVVTRITGCIEEAALFSDGLERLVLDYQTKTAFAPFFEQMFPPLQHSKLAGRNRPLSTQLRSFLDSPSVNDRTDDDKTLILARRGR